MYVIPVFVELVEFRGKGKCRRPQFCETYKLRPINPSAVGIASAVLNIIIINVHYYLLIFFIAVVVIIFIMKTMYLGDAMDMSMKMRRSSAFGRRRGGKRRYR